MAVINCENWYQDTKINILLTLCNVHILTCHTKVKVSRLWVLKVLLMKILTPVFKAATFDNSTSNFSHKPKPVFAWIQNKINITCETRKRKGF